MAQTTVEEGQALESTTVGIFRTATVVKGGRRFSFAALVVVGDRRGNVGLGYGKGRGVPVAIEKAQKEARKNLFRVPMTGGTLPHPVEGRFGSSRVRMLPAAPGTGVVAGGTVRAVLEMAGVADTITKAFGSSNQKNLCKAVVEGLQSLRTRENVAAGRGVSIESTAVDEMLEASQRSLEEQESATSASQKSEEKGQRSQASRSGGGGVGSKRKSDKDEKGKGKKQSSGEREAPATDQPAGGEASSEDAASQATATAEVPADESAAAEGGVENAQPAQPEGQQASEEAGGDEQPPQS